MVDPQPVVDKRVWRKARVFLFGIATLAPLLYLIYLVWTMGVNFPFGDQWALIPFFQEQDQGKLDLADLWAQHNEHRLLLPRLYMISLAGVTSWNIRYEMFSSIALAIFAFVLLILLLRANRADVGDRTFPWIVVAFSLIVFSPVQWENWLWGWQLQWYMAVVGFLGAVFGLNAWPRGRSQSEGVAFAIGAALFGTISLSLGLLIWIACLPSLVFKKEMRRYLLVWMGFTALSSTAYLIGFVKPPYHPPLTAFLEDPLQFAQYVFIYLGNLAGGQSAVLAGVAGIGVFSVFVGSVGVLALRNKEAALASLHWVSLGLYALGAAVITGIGRVGFGAGQGFSSRYTTISMLGVISSFVLIIMVIRAPKSARSNNFLSRLAPAPLSFLLTALPLSALLAYSYPRAVESMKDRHALMMQFKSCLDAAQSYEEPCVKENPNLSKEWFAQLEYLRSREWAGFTSESMN